MAKIDSSTSIRVDGDESEWNTNFIQITKDLNVTYGFAQDNESIKVLVKINDEQTLKKVVVQGITVWINKDGKSKKKIGVKYPLGLQQTGDIRSLLGGMNPGEVDREGVNGTIFEELNNEEAEIGLIGIADNSKEVYSFSKEELNIPIEVSKQAYSLENFVVEYSIPKNLFKSSKKDVFAIGIEIEGIDVQEMMREQMANRGGALGGRGIAGGGRMGGTGRAGMQERMKEMQALKDPVMIWKKVEWTK